MGDRAQIWRDTQIWVINYVLVRTSRMCFNTKYVYVSKAMCINNIVVACIPIGSKMAIFEYVHRIELMQNIFIRSRR